MAGGGCGMISMSRLSQDGANDTNASKHLNSNSQNSAPVEGKKRGRKRKTLSSRYTAGIHRKRRKIGLSSINDPCVLPDQPNQEASAPKDVLALNKCDDTVIPQKRPKGRPRKYPKPTDSGGANSEALLRNKSPAVVHHSSIEGFHLRKDVSNSKEKSKSSPATEPLDHATECLEFEELDPEDSLRTSFGLGKNYQGVAFLVSSRKGDSRTNSSLNSPNRNIDGADRRVLHDSDAQHKGAPKKRGRKKKNYALGSQDSTPVPRKEGNCSGTVESVIDLAVTETQDQWTRKQGLSADARILRPRRQLKRIPENKLLPVDYVGKRVLVYWPHAKAWFAGEVVKYDECTKKHKIKYDDGDEECISFRRHKVMLEVPSEAQSTDNGHHDDEEDISLPRAETSGQTFNLTGSRTGFTMDNGFEDPNATHYIELRDAYLPSRHFKEISSRSIYNSTSIRTPKEKTDGGSSKSEDFLRQKLRKNGKPIATEYVKGHETDKKSIEFVYVRRPKTRNEADTPSTDMENGGDDKMTIGDYKAGLNKISFMRFVNSQVEGYQQQEITSESQMFPPLEHSDKMDFSNLRNISLAPCFHPTVDGSLREHASRKRNTRSLKKLVGQVMRVHENQSGEGLLLTNESCHRTQGGRIKRYTKQRMGRMGKFNESKFSRRECVLSSQWASFEMTNCSVANSLLSPGNKSLLHANQCEETTEKRKKLDDRFQCKPQTAFEITIQFLLPVINPDLFTWQLFNILVAVGFCRKFSFEDRICVIGSVHDMLGIVRLLFSIMKSMSITSWLNNMSNKKWQARILYDLWNVLSGCASWCHNVPVILPDNAERIFVEHVWSAFVNCKMTARQILNVLVCYFIRPYIIATICEKGAIFKAVFNQFMLVKPKERGIPYITQSVKCFRLHSGPDDADSVFSSYLLHILEIKDWFSDNGVFLKQMEKWVESATIMGHAEQIFPISAVGIPNHQALQLTTVRLANSQYSSVECESKVLHLKHNGAKFYRIIDGFLTKIHNLKAGTLHLELNFVDGYQMLYPVLYLLLLLNRKLHHQKFPFSEVGVRSLRDPHQSENTCISQLHLKNVRKEEVSCPKIIFSPVDDIRLQHVKIEPDIDGSKQSSSITSGFNSIEAIAKEESSIELYRQKRRLRTSAAEPDMKGQHDLRRAFKEMEGEISGQIDHNYYAHKRRRDAKKGRRGGPRQNDQGHHVRVKMAQYSIADLVIGKGETVWKGPGAKVKFQITKSKECIVVVNQGETVYAQKVQQGSRITSNPPQLLWKSDEDWWLEFRDKEQWDIFRKMYNDFLQKSVQVMPVKSVPIPGTKLIEDEFLRQLRSFSRPPYAIRHADDEIEFSLKNKRILYDLDSEDEAWLVEYNREQNLKGNDTVNMNSFVSDDLLERVIDKLEKESYRQKTECRVQDSEINEDSIQINNAFQLCMDLAPADAVNAIYDYWLKKRLKKGKALVRHFQPPPREQYEKELKCWEMKMAQYTADEQKRLMEKFPRPQISAFCLECKDSVDKSRKMLRQRSQKKMKPSRSSSEDSHRALGFRFKDSAWHASYPSQQAGPSLFMQVGLQQCQFHNWEHSEKIGKAKSVADTAKTVAAARVSKFRKRFLDFDSILQKAWALLIDYEASMGSESSADSECVNAEFSVLFSYLRAQEGDSSEDEPPSDIRCLVSDVEEDFLGAFTKKCSISEVVDNQTETVLKVDDVRVAEQTFCRYEDQELDQTSRKQDALEETSPLLPISVQVYSYSWIGSSLLQNVDKQD